MRSVNARMSECWKPRLPLLALLLLAVQTMLPGTQAGLGDQTTIVRKVPGALQCYTVTQTMRVRFASLKTTKGNVFTQKHVQSDFLTCLNNLGASRVLKAINIFDCANKAEAEGLPAFEFENNICTGLNGAPAIGWIQCRADDTTVRIYITNVPRSEQIIPAPAISNLQLTSTLTDITVTWDVVGPQCSSVVDGYRVGLQQDSGQVVQTKTKTLSGLLGCTDYTVHVSAVNSQGVNVGVPVAESVSTETQVPRVVATLVKTSGDGVLGANWQLYDNFCQLVEKFRAVLTHTNTNSVVNDLEFTKDQRTPHSFTGLAACWDVYVLEVFPLDSASQTVGLTETDSERLFPAVTVNGRLKAAGQTHIEIDFTLAGEMNCNKVTQYHTLIIGGPFRNERFVPALPTVTTVTFTGLSSGVSHSITVFAALADNSTTGTSYTTTLSTA